MGISGRRKHKPQKAERQEKEILSRHSRGAAEMRVTGTVQHLGETSFRLLWTATFIQGRRTRAGTGRQKSRPRCSEERWTTTQVECQKVWFAKLGKKLKGDEIAICHYVRSRHRTAKEETHYSKDNAKTRMKRICFPWMPLGWKLE